MRTGGAGDDGVSPLPRSPNEPANRIRVWSQGMRAAPSTRGRTLLEPAVRLEDHPDGRSTSVVGRSSITSVFSTWIVCSREVRRPPADPEPDRDLAARPPRGAGDLGVGEPSKPLHGQVEQGIEVGADIGHRAGGLLLALGQRRR